MAARAEETGNVAQILDDRIVIFVGFIVRMEWSREMGCQVERDLVAGLGKKSVAVALRHVGCGQRGGDTTDKTRVVGKMRLGGHAGAFQSDPIRPQVAKFERGGAHAASARDLQGGTVIRQPVGKVDDVGHAFAGNEAGEIFGPVRQAASVMDRRAAAPVERITRTQIDAQSAVPEAFDFIGEVAGKE